MKNAVHLMRDIPKFIWQFLIGPLKHNDSTLAAALRSRLYGTVCGIDTDVVIRNSRKFKAGKGSWLYNGCYILNNYGNFTMGESSHLGASCYVNVCYGNVSLGHNVAVGPGTKIIVYSNSYARGKKITDEKIVEDIIIGNNVFIGANCVILPGTSIQDNVVIGAGSIVKGCLESNGVYAGVPCKLIKTGWYE